MNGVSESELTAVIQALQQATVEEIDENIDIEMLKSAAQSFINNYNILEKTFRSQQMSMMKKMLSVNTLDASGNNTMQALMKTWNLKTLYTRSKYLLAFQFDAVLTKFRGQVPRYATYVYVDTQGVPQTFKMPLKDLIGLLNKEGRIGNPQDTFFIKREYNTLEQEQMQENIQQQAHIKIAQTAYQGTVNRLNRYYDVYNLTGGFRQGGRLLWLESAGVWAIARVNNGGDLKEAYVAALMTKHKEKQDPLCYDDIGVAPYFSHGLIKDFFTNYITGISNMAAIREEDVVTDKGQYAVKGARASAPSFNQYLTVAQAILTQGIVNKKDLEDYIISTWDQDVHRNNLERIVNVGVDTFITDMQKILNS